ILRPQACFLQLFNFLNFIPLHHHDQVDLQTRVKRQQSTARRGVWRLLCLSPIIVRQRSLSSASFNSYAQLLNFTLIICLVVYILHWITSDKFATDDSTRLFG
ncbi:hypothetical protein CROQUDRAFT_105658, partial [Cronartium quercuum f. sp. fusiforme G11]